MVYNAALQFLGLPKKVGHSWGEGKKSHSFEFLATLPDNFLKYPKMATRFFVSRASRTSATVLRGPQQPCFEDLSNRAFCLLFGLKK
jgi:hypothetical protein